MTARKPSTAAHTWELKREIFVRIFDMWEVTLAKKIIMDKPRPIFQLELEPFRKYLGEPGRVPLRGVRVDWDKIKSDQINLEDPLLLAYDRRRLFPIDGWHRIAKALRNGLKVLPATKLTREESTRVYSYLGPRRVRRRRRR